MIVRKSFRRHWELDWEAAEQRFAALLSNARVTVDCITSPWDLFVAERSLECNQHARGSRARPVDVFVFGKGEPDDPSCTKVGGRPFWPKGRDWPTKSDGSPMLFLAQFNFLDSKDIFDMELPGDVLTLVVDSKEDWLWDGEGLYGYWLPSGIEPDNAIAVPSAIDPAGPFFGVIHRTADYPDVDWVLNGTKIGGVPYFIQDGTEARDKFLCQLGSIQPAPDVPYPWVNHEEPLGFELDQRGIYGAENNAVFGDLGSVYFFIGADGDVWHSFECY